MGVEAVGVPGCFLHRNLHSQRTGDVRSVTLSALPVVHAAHVHDFAVHPPSQKPIGQWGEEAEVGGEGVGGEDVRV